MTQDTEEIPVESATQTLLKKKTSSKAKVVTETTEDVIALNAVKIEQLGKDESIAMVHTLLEEDGLNDFKIGGVLRHIRQNSWYEGYTSFDDMVEKVYGIKKRKAAYLSAIYESLVENQVPWDKVSKLGWTRLLHIAHLLTLDNVEEYVAKFKDMTVLQVIEVVKGLKAASEGENATDGSPITSTVSTLTLKVHDDQKVIIREAMDKAKLELDTEYDTVAMESICIGYLGGAVNINKVGTAPDLTEMMKQKTVEEVMAVFEVVFPDVNITVEM